ncbi:MAG: hypothetical protein R2911_13150 [Caldilineaceae bacterium]
MHIDPLQPVHARDAARLHIAGQPGTFLTSLGPPVLTVFYDSLPRSAKGSDLPQWIVRKCWAL